MYGLELLIREKKSLIYVLALWINASINYYFFVSSVLLIVLYVIFRLELYRISAWKREWKTFLSISGYSIIGAGLAGIALFPSLYAILGSGKATEAIGTKMRIFYWPQKIMEHLKVMVAPIESGRYLAFFDASSWTSTGLYLPVFGIYCVLLWCFKKNDWLKKLVVLLSICFFIPVLNAAFNLFSSTDYTRWLYGLALLFSLMTVLTLEEVEAQIQKFSKRTLACLTVFTSFLLLGPATIYFLQLRGISLINRFCSVTTTEQFMGYPAIVITIALTVINYSVLWYIVARDKIHASSILGLVAIMCAVNFFAYNALNFDFHPTEYSNDYYYTNTLKNGDEETDLEYSYRIDYPAQITNYGLFKNIPAVNYYNSIQNENGSRFAEAVGIADSMTDTILEVPESGRHYIDALLSVKFFYDYDGNSEIPDGFEFRETENGVAIYENRNYIPMGFTYNSYCVEDELSGISQEERAELMLKTLVISGEDEAKIAQLMNSYDKSNINESYLDAIDRRREASCSSFVGTSRGFSAEIELEKDNIVFFSVPYDKGWDIHVNGEKAETFEVNYGLMGIRCNQGENIIQAEYHVQGLRLGIICTIFFLTVWAVSERILKEKREEK